MDRNEKTPKAAPAAAPVVLIPGVTAFDFLDGAFARSERARLTGLGMVGGAGIILAVTLAFGALGTVEAGAQEDLLVQTESNRNALLAELGTLDSVEGIPTTQIEAHVASRQAALSEATGAEIDTTRVLRDLWAGAPSGAQITAVQFAEAAEGPGRGTLSVTAQVSGFALISQWSQALQATPGLTDVDVSWSGGGESVTAKVTATLTDEALSDRALQSRPPSGGRATDAHVPGQADPTNPADVMNEINREN